MRPVDRQQRMIGAEAVAVRIGIGEEPALQHLVRAEADPGHDVGRAEGGLLDLGEIILGVAVQHHLADLEQRIVLVRPHLGEVEGIQAIFRGVGLGHELHADAPGRRRAIDDSREQVARGVVGVDARHPHRLLGGEVRDPLARLEMILDPDALALGVDPAEGVAAEPVHVAIGARRAAVREQDGHLVQGLRRQREEIPHRRRVLEIGLRVALLRVDEVREFQRVAQEEHRRVVADDVVIAFLGVELHGEATRIAFGIGRSLLAADGGKTQEDLGLLADGGQERRLGPVRDVAGDAEDAVGAGALGMDDALGDALAVEMRELLDEMEILQQDRSARPGGQAVLIVGDRRTGTGGQRSAHGPCPPFKDRADARPLAGNRSNRLFRYL